MKTATKGVLFVRNLNGEAKRLFKGTVYRRGDTVSEVVEALIRLYVRDPDAAAADLILTKLARKK